MRYEKGHKDASRRRIMQVAAGRFRREGIAAAGLAGIMSEAGLTNGAFYPHFASKAALVEESVTSAMDDQAANLQSAFAAGGIEAVLKLYLSAAHRDHPASGCTFAALLPELARQPLEQRKAYTERILAMARGMAGSLPGEFEDREAAALAIVAMLIGTLQLARVAKGTSASDRMLRAGVEAARSLTQLNRKPRRKRK